MSISRWTSCTVLKNTRNRNTQDKDARSRSAGRRRPDEVRAEFIDGLAQRKTAIPGGAIFALVALQDSRDLLSTYWDNRIDTAGMSSTAATNALVTWICRSRQVKAAGDQGKSLWRGGSNHCQSIARFLRFLASVGYTLSAAEEAAAGGEPFAISSED